MVLATALLWVRGLFAKDAVGAAFGVNSVIVESHPHHLLIRCGPLLPHGWGLLHHSFGADAIPPTSRYLELRWLSGNSFGHFWFALWLPLWLPLLISSTPLLWQLVLMTRRRRAAKRQSAGLCVECGYDLRASGDRCPECGHVIGHASQAGTSTAS